MIDPAVVAERVAQIQDTAVALTGSRIFLVAVTKSFGCDALRAAVDAGCDAIGENYAQELLGKSEQNCLVAPVHFIGALQSNKVRQIAPLVALWQSVDRVSVVREIARHRPGAEVLLQVNTTDEESKSGVIPTEFAALYDIAVEVGLHVRGVMTLGPTNGDRTERLRAFGLLQDLRNRYELEVCSMGMTDDYREALECGATMLRIGSGLFGARI